MKHVYRICRAGRDPLSGEGGLRAAGRWHWKGTAVIYAAATESLAMLEVLVHVRLPQLPRDHVCYKISIPDDLVEELAETWQLLADWRQPDSPLSRDFGTLGAESQSGAVLVVPSVIVPRERNYLLNPVQRDFPRISVTDSWKVEYDPRLLKSGMSSLG